MRAFSEVSLQLKQDASAPTREFRSSTLWHEKLCDPHACGVVAGVAAVAAAGTAVDATRDSQFRTAPSPATMSFDCDAERLALRPLRPAPAADLG